MLVERACSSTPLLLRPHFLVRLLAIVFAGSTMWFVWNAGSTRPDAVVVFHQGPAAPAPAPAAPARAGEVNVVDVAAAAVSPELVAQLVRLADGERITSVDDRTVESTLEAGTLLAARVARITSRARARLADASGFDGSGGEYIDLSVHGAAGSRRVLVLFH